VSESLVLCYHAVSPTWEAELSVTPDAFERQIDHFLRRGWRATTFSDAVLNPPRGGRTLAVTFDDAFASVEKYAAPILERFGAYATVFAPTAFPSGGKTLAWAGIEHYQGGPDANELVAMDWNDLGRLAERGWEIGSHTRTHPRLTQLDDERLELELSESRDECGAQLGRECQAIAYPYGDVDERVAAAARRVGYRCGAGLSSSLRPRGPHRVPRLAFYYGDAFWRFRLKAARPMRALRASKLWSRAER
jgi:peptidoglycan/xylan/chitin deacetylase (PgdA/CDA1 family)